MKIAIATVQVPFIRGGAEIHAEMLRDELLKRHYEADIITIPFKWSGGDSLIKCMFMGRLMDITEVNGEKIDAVICTKFPAFYLKHPNKILWLCHQHRQAYDLWGTEYGDIERFENGESIRKLIIKCDNEYISEAKRVFTIAKNTSSRLYKYNGIESTVLYQPPLGYEKMHNDGFGDYVFYPSRIDKIKGQRLLVEAMKHTKTTVKAIIAGRGSKDETNYLMKQVKENKLEEKIQLVGYISDERKIDYYAKALGVYFGAYDEDYGYITLESFFSHKPIIVHNDAGGPLEFVKNDENGFIIEREAKLLAEKIDELYLNKEKAKKMGEAGYHQMLDLNINWDYIITKLLKG